jgi:hypothetical protein
MNTEKAANLSGVKLPEDGANEMAVRNLAAYKDQGYEVSEDWDRNAPFVESLERGAWLIQNRPHFLDHVYRLVKDDKTIYGSEPYGLGKDDIAELHKLSTMGWRVWIGQDPLWYPGRTTQILFEREQLP